MKMGPDRINYQVWLIDYLDGALDEQGQSLLLAFLEQNPDLREELNDLTALSVKAGKEIFSGKEKLRKDPSMIPLQQFELLCIGAVENELSEEQRSELEAALSSQPEKERIFKLYRKSVLRAPEVKFRYKNKLKKQPLGIRLLRYSLVPLAAAAAVLLFLTILRNPVPQEPVRNNLALSSDTSLIKGELPLKRLKVPVKVINAQVNSERPVKKFNQMPAKIESQPHDTTTLSFARAEVPGILFSKPELAVAFPDIRLARVNINPVSDMEDAEEPRLFSFISRVFREKINKSGGREKGPLKAYEIADAGITGLNKLLGWDMTLQKQRNLKGEVTSVSFNSKLLKFNAPVKRGS